MLTTAIIWDVILGVILVGFTLLGIQKGLVRTLLGLIGLFVALIGAYYVAEAVTPVLSPIAQSYVSSTVEARLTDYLEGQELPSLEGLSTSQVRDILDHLGYKDVTLESDGNGLTADTVTDLTDTVTTSITRTLVYWGIFLIAFLLIVVLWSIAVFLLDQAAKLPVLRNVNHLGGGILGLLKGSLFLYAVLLALRYATDWIPNTLVADSYILRFFCTINPVDWVVNGLLRW